MVSVMLYFTRVASAHLVRYSGVVMMYLSPVLLVGGLIGPKKSISHLSNAYNFTCGRRGISSLFLGLPTLSSLCEWLATIILHVVPSVGYRFLRSVLLPIPHGLLLKFLVIRAPTRTFIKFYLRPFYIDVLWSIDSRLCKLPGSSFAWWYNIAVWYLFSSTR
jgi:hypothetical protein